MLKALGLRGIGQVGDDHIDFLRECLLIVLEAPMQAEGRRRHGVRAEALLPAIAALPAGIPAHQPRPSRPTANRKRRAGIVKLLTLLPDP